MFALNAWLADLTRAFGGADGQGAAAIRPVLDSPEPDAADSAFDNFTRSLGSQTSRRQVVKVSVLGMFGALLGDLGLREARAAADCLCGRQLYDPAVQCCTPTGVKPKHPVADLASCPNKVVHPGYTCVPNGCGPAGGTSYPNGFGSASFMGCCNTHDCCYGACNNAKGGCDGTFGTCMHSACDAAYPPDIRVILGVSVDVNRVKRASCNSMASSYFQAVNNFGGDAFTAAQQAGCDCCGTQPCPTCPGGTCSSLPSCQDPGCVCFQTIEGKGFCHLPQSCAGLSGCASSANCPAGWACVNVTCCGGSAICIRPCFVVNGAAAVQRSSLASTGEPVLTTAGWQ